MGELRLGEKSYHVGVQGDAGQAQAHAGQSCAETNSSVQKGELEDQSGILHKRTPPGTWGGDPEREEGRVALLPPAHPSKVHQLLSLGSFCLPVSFDSTFYLSYPVT